MTFIKDNPQLIQGAAIIAVGIIMMLYIAFFGQDSTPLVTTDDQEGSTVFFEVSQAGVFLPSACVTAQWHVENITAVYLEGEGVVGQDSRQWCVLSQGNRPTLEVHFPDASIQEYTLAIRVGITRFVFLLGGLLVVIGVFVTRIPPVIWIEDQVKRQHRLVTALIYLWVFGILFVYWAVNGRPGLSLVLGAADRITVFVSEFFTAPYQG